MSHPLSRLFSTTDSSRICGLKICGLTDPENTLAVDQLKPSALGLNFWPSSRRYCPPERAHLILKQITHSCRVGVFVNNAPEIAPSFLHEKLLDIIQLHGDESIEEIEQFLTTGASVIRALSIDALTPNSDLPENLSDLASRFPDTFAVLLDAPAGSNYGGTGTAFDWTHAIKFREKTPHLPFLLAGGITPANAEKAIRTVSPHALDIASGAESSPGIKDLSKVHSLIQTTFRSKFSDQNP